MLNILHAHDLSLLDWEAILNGISGVLHFEKSKQELKNIFPKTREEIEWAFDSLDYYLRDYDNNSDFFDRDIRCIRPQKEAFEGIRALSKAKYYEIDELHFLATLCEGQYLASKQFKTWNLTLHYEIDQRIQQIIHRTFTRPLREFVTKDGEVHYDRHPVLKPIFNKIMALEQELRSRIQGIARRPEYALSLELGAYDLIYDRYVLPMPTDSYRSSLGPIIAKSSSGKTLYIEPPELREKSNDRIEQLALLEEALLAVSRDLSEALHPYSSEVERMAEYLVSIDLISAKANYVLEKNLQRPRLSTKFKIILEGFFHPLIENPVRNDLALEFNHHGLVLSGPNTGGKTAALKAISLAHLFIHMGLFIPARTGEIFPVSNLYYFSSDDQNLSEGLSSFSSEVKNYLMLLQDLGEFNLILIDEIFSSTSSEEASALAMALLREIGKVGNSKILISTHHQVLKTFMHGDKEFVSARVGYDLEKGPTYKLYTDGPGSSMAFTIFENLEKRFGRKTSIPMEAQKFLDKKQIAYEKLLQELAEKKGELEKLLLENRQINIEIKNQKKSMEGLVSIERQRRLNDLKDEIEDIASEARKIVEEARAKKIENPKTLDKSFAKIKSKVAHAEGVKEEVEVDPHPNATVPSLDDIVVGNIYYSALLKKEIRILEINRSKNEVKVSHHKMTLHCPISTLRFIGKKKVVPFVKFHVERTTQGKIEVDGRGMRLEEFEALIDRGLLDLQAGDIPYLHVIHGHGDGVLKRWLRETLSKSQDYSWKPEDGNDGVTMIELIR